MFVRVFGAIIGDASIKSIIIDSHDIVRTFRPVINNAFEYGKDCVIDGCADFAFIRYVGCRKYCKLIWMHDTQASKIVSHAQELPLNLVIGAFERKGECYAYGPNITGTHNDEYRRADMHLARIGGSAETLFKHFTRLWASKPSMVMDYYGEYLYMSIETDGNAPISSNIDFVRTKTAGNTASKPIAAFGDSVYWLHEDNMVHTDWRSGNEAGVFHLQSSMLRHFSTSSTFISSATYIDDVRFVLHDNASSVCKDTHIAVFDRRNLTEVCCGYQVTEECDDEPQFGRTDIYLRNFGS